MKLLNSNNESQIVLSQEPWAIEIRNRYGSAENFISIWSPKNQLACIERYNELGHCPPLVRITRSYGKKISRVFIASQLADAVVYMGEKVDKEEVMLTSDIIVSDERLMTLTLPTIMVFFNRLKSGQFEIYGNISPRKILQEMQKFFKTGMEMQVNAQENYNRKIRLQNEAKHKAEVIPASEWLKDYGVNSITEYVIQQMKKQQ